MKIINAREFHKNPGCCRLKYDEVNVLVRRNKPVCILSPITEENFFDMKLKEDIRAAFEEIRNGECVSHQEVTKRLLGRELILEFARYDAVYAKWAIKDLEMAGKKYQEKILKKIYEKCHFMEPFDSYFDEYMQIRAGKYVVVCKPDEKRAERELPDGGRPGEYCKDTINILCIYPPNGSLKERFRLW